MCQAQTRTHRIIHRPLPVFSYHHNERDYRNRQSMFPNRRLVTDAHGIDVIDVGVYPSTIMAMSVILWTDLYTSEEMGMDIIIINKTLVLIFFYLLCVNSAIQADCSEVVELPLARIRRLQSVVERT